MSTLMPRVTLPERFWNQVNKRGPKKIHMKTRCWVWTRSLDSKGYARFKMDGVTRPAHHYTFEAKYGSIPEGKELDHLCETRSCVRPSHCEAVTHQENVSRALAGKPSNNPNVVKKTRCHRGHRYSKANTYRYPDGRRRCQTCQRENRAKYNSKVSVNA